MSHKPSHAYLNARAALLDILSDGQRHDVVDVMNELERRGIDFEAASRAEDRLGVRILADMEAQPILQYFRLPRVLRPDDTPVWVWTVKFLVKQFETSRCQPFRSLIDEALEHGIPLWALRQAMGALGITQTRRQTDAGTEVEYCWPTPARPSD